MSPEQIKEGPIFLDFSNSKAPTMNIYYIASKPVNGVYHLGKSCSIVVENEDYRSIASFDNRCQEALDALIEDLTQSHGLGIMVRLEEMRGKALLRYETQSK